MAGFIAWQWSEPRMPVLWKKTLCSHRLSDCESRNLPCRETRQLRKWIPMISHSVNCDAEPKGRLINADSWGLLNVAVGSVGLMSDWKAMNYRLLWLLEPRCGFSLCLSLLFPKASYPALSNINQTAALMDCQAHKLRSVSFICV